MSAVNDFMDQGTPRAVGPRIAGVCQSRRLSAAGVMLP